MKIPVFVSCPTVLNSNQEKSRNMILKEIQQIGLEMRTLGKSDYPTDLPLREVHTIARHCAGGIILGFSQFRADSGVWKDNTTNEKIISTPCNFPTPWNQLEAGILFTLGLPLIVFKEDNIQGGIFDNGVTDVFIQKMPAKNINLNDRTALRSALLKWQAAVRIYYYNQ